MHPESKSDAVTREANIVRGPQSRRAEAEAAVAKLALPYEVRTDAPDLSTYTDIDPEPTWILALGDPEQAALVKELLDRKV